MSRIDGWRVGSQTSRVGSDAGHVGSAGDAVLNSADEEEDKEMGNFNSADVDEEGIDEWNCGSIKALD